jgi:hypothetical protein
VTAVLHLRLTHHGLRQQVLEYLVLMPAVVVAAQAAALELVAPVVAVEQVMVHLLKEQRAVRQVLTQAQAVVAAQMVLALALVAVQE